MGVVLVTQRAVKALQRRYKIDVILAIEGGVLTT